MPKQISDELFNELKESAIKIWQTYDNSYGYVDEKIAMMQFKNIGDNYGTIIGMFDIHNQRKLYDSVSPEAQKLIDDWNGGSLAQREQEAADMGLM